MRIPPATTDGLLPHDVRATFDEIDASYLVSGAGYSQRGVKWCVERRRRLLASLHRAVTKIDQHVGGVTRWWLGGSFVEVEPSPTDIDCYFELADADPATLQGFEARMEALEPRGLYSLDPRNAIPCHGPVRRRPLWCQQQVDLWPETGAPCGIYGPENQPLVIAHAFRQRRTTYQQKGIIELILHP